MNATAVVKEVKNIGRNNAFNDVETASLTFPFFRTSRKNRVIKWTPSELAMVSKTMGIDVFIIEK
jgi:hypothetical protein